MWKIKVIVQIYSDPYFTGLYSSVFDAINSLVVRNWVKQFLYNLLISYMVLIFLVEWAVLGLF